MNKIPAVVATILCLVAAEAAVEVAAWWWMNPPPAGVGSPLLVYRPEPDQPSAGVDQENADQTDQTTRPEHDAGAAEFDILSPSSVTTPLPELVSRAQPQLRCSDGSAFRLDQPDGPTIYFAFFEWNRESSANVLEAFRHMPEECLGAIGLKHTATLPPRTYVVREQQQKSGIQRESHSADGTSPAAQADHTLSFDHTVFLDPAGGTVHAFKAVWIRGGENLIGSGFRGGSDQYRRIRMKAALQRFQPTHTRVVQGSVHGVSRPDRAWHAFEQAILQDLRFETPPNSPK